MALVKLTAFLDNLSGSLGDVTFSRTKGGLAVRQRSNGWNVSNPAWFDSSTYFLEIYKAWRDMPPTNKEAWKAFARTVPYQNRLGDTEYYSGYSAFQKYNNPLARYQHHINLLPEIPDKTLKIDDVFIARLDSTHFDIDFKVAGPDKPYMIMFWASNYRSLGQTTNTTFQLLYVKQYDNIGTYSLSLASQYFPRYPYIPSPRKIFVRLQILDIKSGAIYGTKDTSGIIT